MLLRARCLTRRKFLARAASAATVATLGNIARPYLSHAASRPLITHGIQSGDVSTNSAMVWARADRPSRMLVEAATTRQLQGHPQRGRHRRAAGKRFHRKGCCWRISRRARTSSIACGLRTWLRRPSSSEAQVGRFRTAPDDRRSVSFVWSGDTAGQGWGIDEARGGMRTYATMRNNRPDFFIHSGDSIYADCPIERELKLPNGEMWRTSSPRRSRGSRRRSPTFAATTNTICSTRNLRAFNAEVPVFAQWDDHEVTNDWWPGQTPRPTMPTPMRRCSRRAAAARSANTCRCGRRRPRPGASIARSRTVRCSMSSCSTCAAIAGRTTTTRMTRRRRNAASSAPRKCEWLKRELHALATRPGR